MAAIAIDLDCILFGIVDTLIAISSDHVSIDVDSGFDIGFDGGFDSGFDGGFDSRFHLAVLGI